MRPIQIYFIIIFGDVMKKVFKYIIFFAFTLSVALLPCILKTNDNNNISLISLAGSFDNTNCDITKQWDVDLTQECIDTTKIEAESNTLGAFIPNNDTGIADTSLYNALVAIYKNIDTSFKENKLYKNMFASISELNLRNNNISSISGLKNLNLDSLTSIDLSFNNLSSIDLNEFSQIGKNCESDNMLHTINLSCNKITTVSVYSLPSLQNLFLQENLIKGIDISTLNLSTLNISNNKITDLNNVKLPISTTALDVFALNNQISSIPDSFDASNINLVLGMQAIDKVFTLSDSIRYNSLLDGVTLNIYQNNELIQCISSSQNITLPCGIYTYTYCDSTGNNLYKATASAFVQYKPGTFKVIPTMPSVEIVANNKTCINEFPDKVLGDVTISITSDAGAINYYSLDGENWTQANTATISKTRTYSIYVKSTINGMDSATRVIQIRASVNNTIPDVLILIIVIVIIIALIFGLLPLIKKQLQKGKNKIYFDK